MRHEFGLKIKSVSFDFGSLLNSEKCPLFLLFWGLEYSLKVVLKTFLALHLDFGMTLEFFKTKVKTFLSVFLFVLEKTEKTHVAGNSGVGLAGVCG